MRNFEIQLKQVIKNQYRTISAFSKAIGIPSSTINTILEKGIETATFKNIFKICTALHIDCHELGNHCIVYKSKDNKPLNLTLREQDFFYHYGQLTDAGKQRVDDTLNREYELYTLRYK